jgi:hypothetical protein
MSRKKAENGLLKPIFGPLGVKVVTEDYARALEGVKSGSSCQKLQRIASHEVNSLMQRQWLRRKRGLRTRQRAGTACG